MGELEILRIIGIEESYIEKFQNLTFKANRAFMWVLIGGIIFVPLAAVAMLFEIQGNNVLFMLLLIVGASPAVFSSFYMMYNIFKTNQEFFKIIEKTWLPWHSGLIMNSKEFKILLAIGMMESFAVFLFFGYLFRELLIIATSFIFLISIPALLWSIKDRGKRGITISHRIKGDVDEISEKISKNLNEEKKLIFKSANNRSYRIIPKLSSLELLIFRDYNYREFTVIDIKGIKEENTGDVARIISAIEGIYKA